jgi:cytochrome c oxidase assembly protein subunit 15
VNALFDWSPLLRLLLLAITLASGPLAWIWVRRKTTGRAQRLQTLATLTVFLCFDLVVFGAFTRLTDSGLGCPDWPGCYGQASPIGALHEIGKAQAALPTGPVTLTKAWIEMLHRYLAMVVGALILVQAALSWTERRQLEVSPGWAFLTLAWVCLQGLFGALTVTMKLFPAIVTLHLFSALVLLCLLMFQRDFMFGQRTTRLQFSVGEKSLLLLLSLTLAVQILLGAWVSTNYAVLMCDTFPKCQGSLWPPMQWQEGFTLWRDLGRTGEGDLLTLPALTAIHYAHRLCAYLVTALALTMVVCLVRRGYRGYAQALGWALLWQVLTGLGNVLLDWPLAIALSHTAGAAVLSMVLTRLSLAVFYRPARRVALVGRFGDRE